MLYKCSQGCPPHFFLPQASLANSQGKNELALPLSLFWKETPPCPQRGIFAPCLEALTVDKTEKLDRLYGGAHTAISDILVHTTVVPSKCLLNCTGWLRAHGHTIRAGVFRTSALSLTNCVPSGPGAARWHWAGMRLFVPRHWSDSSLLTVLSTGVNFRLCFTS